MDETIQAVRASFQLDRASNAELIQYLEALPNHQYRRQTIAELATRGLNGRSPTQIPLPIADPAAVTLRTTITPSDTELLAFYVKCPRAFRSLTLGHVIAAGYEAFAEQGQVTSPHKNEPAPRKHRSRPDGAAKPQHESGTDMHQERLPLPPVEGEDGELDVHRLERENTTLARKLLQGI